MTMDTTDQPICAVLGQDCTFLHLWVRLQKVQLGLIACSVFQFMNLAHKTFNIRSFKQKYLELSVLHMRQYSLWSWVPRDGRPLQFSIEEIKTYITLSVQYVYYRMVDVFTSATGLLSHQWRVGRSREDVYHGKGGSVKMQRPSHMHFAKIRLWVWAPLIHTSIPESNEARTTN